MNLCLRRWMEPFLLSLGGPFRSPRDESDALNQVFQPMPVAAIDSQTNHPTKTLIARGEFLDADQSSEASGRIPTELQSLPIRYGISPP